MASYITIKLNPKHTGNSESPTPWQNPTAAVSAVQSAEWEEGIPPELMSISKSHLLSTKKFKKSFIDWARPQAKRPETKVGLAASVRRKGLTFSLEAETAAEVVMSREPMPEVPVVPAREREREWRWVRARVLRLGVGIEGKGGREVEMERRGLRGRVIRSMGEKEMSELGRRECCCLVDI